MVSQTSSTVLPVTPTVRLLPSKVVLPVSMATQSTRSATFLAAMQTNNGGDTCTLRYRNLTASDVEVQVHEEQSANSEVGHVNEVVGWILIGN